MRERTTATRGAGRLGLLLALLSAAGLLLFHLSSLPAVGQETQTPDGEVETPVAPDTVVRLEVDLAEPLPGGEEFEADVLVENVEHLASFGFTVHYDPDAVEPVEGEEGTDVSLPETAGEDTFVPEIRNIGEFILPSDRGASMLCPLQVANAEVLEEGEPPLVREDARGLTVDCVTTGPPVCLGGAEGASGSGRLATLVFRSKGQGSTTLTLQRSTLILDDAQPPCDPETFRPEEIQHRREDVSVPLEGGGDGGTNTAIWITIAVVAVLVAAAVGGYLWYRSAPSAGTSSDGGSSDSAS